MLLSASFLLTSFEIIAKFAFDCSSVKAVVSDPFSQLERVGGLRVAHHAAGVSFAMLGKYRLDLRLVIVVVQRLGRSHRATHGHRRKNCETRQVAKLMICDSRFSAPC